MHAGTYRLFNWSLSMNIFKKHLARGAGIDCIARHDIEYSVNAVAVHIGLHTRGAMKRLSEGLETRIRLDRKSTRLNSSHRL